MSARDRIIVSAVVALAALAGFWFLALAPKREQVAAADARLTAEQQRLDSARTLLANVQSAKRRYAADYAEIVRLTKAVPGDDDTASLLYELQSVAKGAKVHFDSMKLTAAAAGSPASPVASGAPAPGTSSAGAGTAAASTGAVAAPATQVAAAALPPGAIVGAAGLATMPFSFIFEGRYLDMQHFLADVDRFVAVRGGRIEVSGRLLTVDGLSLATSPDQHGLVKASISATAYVAPTDRTAGTAAPAAGATPAPSAGAAPATGSNTSSAVTAATTP